MSSGAVDQNLRDREKTRRKALWTLSDLRPGDPKAIPVVSMLDQIAGQDEVDGLLRDVAKVEDLRNHVVTERRASGIQIVREESIPEPWRERFLQASMGSTRVETGPFLNDFEKFINLWTQENQRLEEHRSAIGKKI
ncbi:hypothetical protein E5170_09620 [Pseudomonas atacamensis]|uniref:Uncharacterized protein n=1 Tax=Pseudomonas atacamensis TaxID=2565368 RepID=A0AAQ2DE82_9PSED|nr:hypothetical protein [Pseudomonas atacamensis]THF34504.1 hypothetical protein E5170_09620 [Pseudomonas atacamensis]